MPDDTIVAAPVWAALVLAVSLGLAAPARGDLVPAPEKMVRRGDDLRLTGHVLINVSPRAGDVERYAAERLAALLKARLGLHAQVSNDLKSSGPVTIWLGTPKADERLGARLAALGARVTPSDPGPEGFRIRVRRSGQRVEVAIAGSDTSGALYGALSLPQLTSRRDGAVAIRQVDVDDRPVVRVRAVKGFRVEMRARRGLDANVYRYYFDWLAENRINFGCYRVTKGMSLPPGFANMVREAHRRGIRVFGGIRGGSYNVAGYICPSDPDQVKDAIRIYDEFLDAGCDGIALMLDDIRPDYLSGHCDRCRQRFGSLGGEQAFLLHEIVQHATERRIALDDIYFCPTYYQTYDGSSLDYFRHFMSDPLLKQIRYFMTFSDGPQIERFRKDTGLKYIWWYNGPRSISYFSPAKAHYAQADVMYYPLMYGRHGLHWDWGRRGFSLPDPWVVKMFANMPKYTDVVFINSGGDFIHGSELAQALWGIYGWRPAAFRQDAAEASVLTRVMGPDACRWLQRANRDAFVAVTALEPPCAYSLARIHRAIADARASLTKAREHYARFWKACGRLQFPEAARQIVLKSLAYYEPGLRTDEECSRALAVRDRAVSEARSRRVDDLSPLARWRSYADGDWRVEVKPPAIQLMLPSAALEHGPGGAQASIRVRLPKRGRYQIIFSVSDIYTNRGTPHDAVPGVLTKQVVVNGKVIWEDGVEGDETIEEEALQRAEFDGQGEVEIKLIAAQTRDLVRLGTTIYFAPLMLVRAAPDTGSRPGDVVGARQGGKVSVPSGFQRPVRIPEDVQLGIAEPPVAKAGEKDSWLLNFVLAKAIPDSEKLLLYVHGKRNNKGAWAHLQTDSPSQEGYVCLKQASGEMLRPIETGQGGGFVAFEVPKGGLRSGEHMTAELGGPPGAVAPTLSLPDKFFLLVAGSPDEWRKPVTLYGEVLESIAGACLIHVVGNKAARIRACAKSQAGAGGEVSVLIRPEDEFGNVACEEPGDLIVRVGGRELKARRVSVSHSTCCVLEGIVLPQPGIYRLQVEDVSRALRAVTNPVEWSAGPAADSVLWGMIHGHTEMSDGAGSLDHYFTYMRDECGLDFGATGDHDHLRETSDAMWGLSQEAAARYNEPQRFTTFLGYEWAKWRRNGDGDRNVYYLNDRRPMFRSDDGCYPTPKHLFEALRGETALIIPHHTADVGNHCDWKDHDPEKERLVEIYSRWGNSERSVHKGNPFPVQGGDPTRLDSGEVPAGFVQRALELGWRVGFTAGGDDHFSHAGDDTIAGEKPWNYRAGLMAVWARDNTRESVWEAMWSRRCYATTGARMIVDFRVNGQPMGSELRLAEHPELASKRTIRVSVHGTAPIRSIEIVRNNQDVFTHAGGGLDAAFEWTDADALDKVDLPPALYSAVPFTFYYVRVTQADGEMAWASPIWVSS